MKMLVAFLFLMPAVYAQNSLQVEILNLRNSKGNVAIELLSKDNVSLKGKTVDIVDGKCVIIFEDVEKGTYALRYFHDENANEDIDMNFFGIPKEGIGFSNDAYGKFGPEDFEKWLFPVDGDTKVKLTTTYYF